MTGSSGVGRLVKFLALVAALCLFLLARGHGSSGDPPVVMASAGEQVRAGSCPEAISLCRQVLAKASDPAIRARAQLMAGYCEYKLKRYDSARKRLRDAFRHYPELAFHALYYGALSFQEEERFPEAVELWKKLIQGNPPGDLKARALMQLLRCHRKSGDPAAAASVLDRLREVSLDPAWKPEIAYTRGWIKAQNGAVQQARTILIKLWKQHPESFWADQAQDLLADKGEHTLLLNGKTSAISENDRIERIRSLIKNSLPQKALAELDPLIKRAQKSSGRRRAMLYRLRAKAYMGMRDYSKAIADLDRVQELLGADDMGVTYMKASCFHRAGKRAAALKTYREIWTRNPKSSYASRALYYAASLMKSENDWKKAEKTYGKLVSEFPRSSLRPESLFQLAWIKILERRYEQAKARLDRVPEKAGDDAFNARTLYWKAAVCKKLGEFETARVSANQVLDNYWDTNYAFYLVMVEGRKWPYRPGGKALPARNQDPPREFRIARELYRLGLDDDAAGQLKSLEDQGRLTESLAWAAASMHLALGRYYRASRIASRSFLDRLKTPPPGEIQAWRLAYPRAYQDLVEGYSRKFELDPLLVYSVMRAESTYRPRIRSWAGAVGLMQIMPATAKRISRGLGEKAYRSAWLNDPEVSIRYGCYYLHEKLNRFSDGANTPASKLKMLARALAAYNAGPERVSKWAGRADRLGLSPQAFVEEIPIRETRQYVQRIMGFYLIYLTAYPRRELPKETKAPAATGS